MKIALYRARKIFANFLKCILKLTFYELLCILIAILFYVVIVWPDNETNAELNREIQPIRKLYSKHKPATEFECDIDNNITKIQTRYPAIVWWTDTSVHSEAIACQNGFYCDVFGYDKRHLPANVGAYLFYGTKINFEKLPLPRETQNIWALIHEESPRNVPELLYEEVLNLFNFSSTFSRYSDVPFPLQFAESLHDITSKTYFVDTAVKNSLLKDISPIIFIQSDCSTSTERDDYVRKLMEFIPIDSYGLCLNNKQLPTDMKDDYLNKLYNDKVLKLFARYKFAISIENGVCDDYVTEKFWRPIKVGTVPIYFGSPSIRDWLPNTKSAILLDDFPTPKLLSEHIKNLMTDDNLYEQYLEHKTKGIITNGRLKYELKIRPYQTLTALSPHLFQCFLCEKLHTKNRATVNIVSKSHYNCPKPISALTLGANPLDSWFEIWKSAKTDAEIIYRRVMNKTTCKT